MLDDLFEQPEGGIHVDLPGTLAIRLGGSGEQRGKVQYDLRTDFRQNGSHVLSIANVATNKRALHQRRVRRLFRNVPKDDVVSGFTK